MYLNFNFSRLILVLIFSVPAMFSSAQQEELPQVETCLHGNSTQFNEAHALNHIQSMTSDSAEQRALLKKAREKFERFHQKEGFSGNTTPIKRRGGDGGAPRSDSFDCEIDNWDFEDGSLSNWDVTGNVSIVSEGVDPYGGYEWVFPEGGNFSAKISSDQNEMMNDGTLSREINVPSTGVTYFSFHFAMSIFNYPHLADEASKFYVEFYDEDNNLIPCPNFECFYSSDMGPQGVDGFEVTPLPAIQYNPNADGDSPGSYGVSYTSWNDVTLDLSGYAGQTLRVEFRVEWCIYGPDWSYALVEVDCPVNNGIPNTVCSDYPQEICGIGSGTGNFQSYEWFDEDNNFLGNDECITVNEPGSYFCTVLPIDVDCTEGSAITIEYESIPSPVAEFSTSTATEICVGETVDFINETEYAGDILSTWDFGDGTVVESQDASYTFNDPGEYTVSLVVEGAECINTETLIIDVLPYPEADFDFEVTCASTSVEFTDATTLSYGDLTEWAWDFNGDGTPDSNQQNPTFDFSEPGDYEVSLWVANAAGCSDEFSASVNIPVPLSATVENISDFNGYNISSFENNDGSFSVSPAGGTGDYTITIDGVDYEADEIINGLTAGTYEVLVSDGECDLTLDVELIEPELLVATIEITSDYNGYPISCFGFSDGEATVSVQGGVPPYDYSWSNGTTDTPIAGDLSQGDVSVTVTDLNGVEVVVSTALNEPPPIVLEVQSLSDYNGFNVRCYGGNDGQATVAGEGGTGDLSWTFNGEPGSLNMTGLPAGNILVEATDLNGCTAEMNVLLSQPPLLHCSTNIVSDYNGYHVSCPESTNGAANVTINGGVGPYEATWPDETTGFSHSQLSAGTFLIQISDENNCVSECSYTIEAPPALTTTFDLFPDTCDQSVGEISATPGGGVAPYDVQWNSSVPGLSFNNELLQTELPEGDYEVSILDDNGCSLTSETTLTTIAPAEVKLGVTNYPPCDETDINFLFTTNRKLQHYTWIFPDGTNQQIAEPVYYFNDPGEYLIRLTGTDSYDCPVESTLELEVLPGLRIYTPNSFTPNEDGINDLFGAKGVGITDYHLMIFNSWGEKIFESFDPSDKWNGEVPDGKHYVQNDVYIYRLIVSGNCEKTTEQSGTVTVVR